MINKWKLIAIICLILLLGLGGYLGYNYIKNTNLNTGYEIGYNQGELFVINEINSKGTIPVINNQTINWITLQTICGK